MTNPAVYLAGPVQHADDHGVGWRECVTDLIDGFEFNNPLDKYNVGVNDLTIIRDGDASGDSEIHATEIINADKQLIRESDAILAAFEDIKMTGTPMEVCWCDEVSSEKPIVVWVRDGTSREQMSPWWEHADAIKHSLFGALWELRGRLEVAD
jgi:nucleoside 2-deoxyribosyltransferase